MHRLIVLLCAFALLLPLLLLSLIGAPVFLDLGIRALELANPLYYYLKFAA